MGSRVWAKGLVIGIIFLFVGTSMFPVINANIANNDDEYTKTVVGLSKKSQREL